MAMTSDEKMVAYERRRLENIKRNSEMLASLNVNARLSDLSSSSKRLREEKSNKQSTEKKKKPEKAVVIRRSLRSQGVPPDSNGLPLDFIQSLVDPSSKKTVKISYTRKPVKGPLSINDAYVMEEGSYRAIVEKFTNITNSQSDGVGKSKTRSTESGVPRLLSKVDRVILDEPVDVNSLKLESENIARVVPGKINSVQFIPTTNMTMIVAGSMSGHLGFWDVKPKNEGEDAIHLYQPHTAAISGIYVHPFSLSKVYTSSHDGFVRFMDIEREEFNLLYSSSKSPLTSLSLQPNDANLVYIGEGYGNLNVVDGRVGKMTSSWSLHDMRINTIDFNPANPYVMATSSSDGLACLWDLRKLDVKLRERVTLQSLQHNRSVSSAFFSPSGSSVATTSTDDNIGVISGVNLEDKFMIPHANFTKYSKSPFRAIWGWDDTHLFVGNLERSVDIISVKQRKIIHALESPLVSTLQCRYDAHPCTVGMLATTGGGGQIYIWTASS